MSGSTGFARWICHSASAEASAPPSASMASSGGLLVDGGKSDETAIAPLVAHARFPEEWRVLVILPEDGVGTHGQREREAFAKLAHSQQTISQTEALCRLVLLGILPALAERNLPAFGEALYDFNRRVGELFTPSQGGVYANEWTASLVGKLRDMGIKGVGQSSWGPVVYGILPNSEHAVEIGDWLSGQGGTSPELILVTSASMAGATIQT